MKIPLILPVLALLAASGCSSDVVETVRNPFPLGIPPQIQTFPADERATFAAARSALDSVGFRFVRGGPAQGTLQAISGVGPGESIGSAHQYTLHADFEASLDGASTQVTVSMTEIEEADTEHHQGEGTETPVRDPAVAESFFRALQDHLAAPAK